MVHIDLTAEEQEVLKDVLNADLSDLRMEIHETDDRDFKAELKKKQQVMEKILAALQ